MIGSSLNGNKLNDDLVLDSKNIYFALDKDMLPSNYHGHW